MRRHVSTIVLLCALAVLGGCARQHYAAATGAFDQGDFEQARTAWLRLAQKGDVEAQFKLGSMLAAGQGGPRDDARAAHWFRAAAREGHTPSIERLAYLHLSGQVPGSDDPEIVGWLEDAADGGNPDTKYRVAIAFAEGDPIEHDMERALHWMTRAADQWTAPGGVAPRIEKDQLLHEFARAGLPHAQFLLGKRYFEGKGVPRSEAEAARWYQRAAEQGLRHAQFTFGRVSARGEGVPRDPAAAARWYLKAAEQGHVEAQYQLGMMYARGVGIPRDPVLAHMWFNISAGAGLDKSREQRDTLELEMSLDEILEAEELAVDRDARTREQRR